MGVRLHLSTREMAAATARPLLAVLLLLGAALAVQGRRHARYLTSSSQRELLKEADNEIDHGSGYTSQHKQHQWQKTGHKGHAWTNKFKGGLKKRKFGHPGEEHPKVIDTDEEEEHAEAKQEDGQDVQEDAGEAEAAEEEAASPLKCFLLLKRLPFSSLKWLLFTKRLFFEAFARSESVCQVLPTPVFRVPTDFSQTKVFNNMYKK